MQIPHHPAALAADFLIVDIFATNGLCPRQVVQYVTQQSWLYLLPIFDDIEDVVRL